MLSPRVSKEQALCHSTAENEKSVRQPFTVYPMDVFQLEMRMAGSDYFGSSQGS
jgi:hypothetical protein